jgi:magnesium-transporting ATPase (P-type)
MNEMLLRGCTLKNSGCIHGLVVYTGPESRIQMNAAAPPKKVGALLCIIKLVHFDLMPLSCGMFASELH